MNELTRLFDPRGRLERRLGLVRYDEDVTVGPSPTVGAVRKSARGAGFCSLLNLNTEGEEGQLLSPNEEASWAHTYGMEQERVAVDHEFLGRRCVTDFLVELEGIEKPVYVHSLHGHRAAAMMTIHLGVERGCSGREALDQARELGIDCELQELRSFVEAEVDRRVGRGRG